MTHPNRTVRRPNPLVITTDPDLLDDLVRLHADAGLVADVAIDAASARQLFGPAPLVFVGVDAADECARGGLHHRPNLLLIGRSGTPPAFTLAERIGASHVALIPTAEPWLLEQLCAVDQRTTGPVVAVLGGRGGAGATVLAGGLAVTGARLGYGTMLIDADPLGGGADLVLGWEHQQGLRWPALAGASGRVSPETLVSALPGRGELVVLSWDRGEPTCATIDAMAAALDAGRRGRDLVVVDLPRQLDDAALCALAAADVGYLVVPADVRACAASGRVAALATPHCPKLSLIVRRPASGGLPPEAVAEAIGLPVAGTIRSEAIVRSALDRGRPPGASGRGSLADLCTDLIADIMVPDGVR